MLAVYPQQTSFPFSVHFRSRLLQGFLLCVCLMLGSRPPAFAMAQSEKTATTGVSESLLPGVWRGVHITGHVTYRHRIQVRRQGQSYVADGLSWCSMTEAQAQMAMRDQLVPTVFPTLSTNYIRPLCVQQHYAVTLKEGTVTFQSLGRTKMVMVVAIHPYDKSTGATGPMTAMLVRRIEDKDDVQIETENAQLGTQMIFGSDRDPLLKLLKEYPPDTFTGPLVAPGIVAQDSKEGPGGAGFFRLWREDALLSPPKSDWEKGKVFKLACLDGTTYHYNCYLPKKYDPGVPMPLLMNMSPSGNAQPLSPSMADELGWIMVGLTESHNGPLAAMAANRDAVLLDVQRRFRVNTKRIYFSGFSGGSRGAAIAGQSYPDLCAGILCIGASCTRMTPLRHIPIYFLTGETDMTKDEVKEIYAQEKQAGRKTELKIHPGGHSWGPLEDRDDALRWLAKNTAP